MKVLCPECNKRTKTELISGQIQCRGCRQYLIIELGKVIKVIPKDFILK